MKKLLYIAFAAAVVGVTFSACKKDPAEPLNINHGQNATIQGKVLVVTDRTSNPVRWSALPVTVVAEIDNSDITRPDATGVYRKTATYNPSTGEYSVTVPVSQQGSAVTILVQEFTGKVKDNNGPVDPDSGERTTREFDALWSTRYVQVYGLFPGDKSVNNNFLYTSHSEELTEAVGSEVR